MSWQAPGFLRSIGRYGNWTGPCWSAGRESPPGDPLTDDDRVVEGVDEFDANCSKPHDLAYDAAQAFLLGGFRDGAEPLPVLARYFEMIAEADYLFKKDAVRVRAKTAAGEIIRIASVDLFSVKTAWERTRAFECGRGWGIQYADRIKKMTHGQILSDLGWPAGLL